MKLIIGLGNRGDQYSETRHNVGFMLLDRLAERHGVEWRIQSLFSLTGEWKSKDTVRLLQPNTMMNRSGEALRYIQDWNLTPPDILIVCDDVNIPLGALRLRASGGPGGHHGLESCLAQLGTEDVPRLRVGVGREPLPKDLTEFVLLPFDREERSQLDGILDRAVEACEMWVEHGIHAAMNFANVKTPEGTRE